MSAIASANLYELLGNDHDQDSDKEPEPPTKVVDKSGPRTTKRNAGGEAPVKSAAPTEGRGGRRGGYSGNEGAFRDRTAGANANRERPTDEQTSGRTRGTYEGRGRGRGRGNFDRHSRGVGGDSEKQAGHGWGANEGGAELKDEQAGEAIAADDQKAALTGDALAGDGEPAAEPEPEDNSVSYEEYLKQLAEKKAALGAPVPEARKPNEGSKQDKKWANAKAITKEEEEDFVAASGGKAKRERERKQKQVVEIDQRFVEAPQDRGGRGGFRGGRGRGDGAPRGRGEFRGRGDRGDRGDGGRGGARGRGDGPSRGGPRGGARSGASINTADPNAFPSLGS